MPRLLALFGFMLVAGAAFAQTGRIAATVRDTRGRPIADAIVVAVPTDGPLRPPIAKPREVAILQVDKEFVPKVSLVTVGTPVAFPNNDDVRHHVYSFSAAKHFELPLYQGVPAQPVVFDRPGVVVLGCNIHDWMVAYVYVSESPHAGKTGADGTAEIADLPTRGYTVRVWHPQLEGDELTTQRSVDLARTRRAEVAWTLTLKPEVRVRRAPVPQRGGHY